MGIVPGWSGFATSKGPSEEEGENLGFGRGNSSFRLYLSDPMRGRRNAYATDFHDRDRRGISDRRSGHARPALAYPRGNDREGETPAARAGEDRTAPVGRGSGNLGLRQHQRRKDGSKKTAPRHGSTCQGKWFAAGFGRHAPLRRLAHARDYP